MKVEPIADTAATLFYDKLFELNPALRPLFPSTDLREQKKKLMQTLTVAVRGLYRLDDLTPAPEALGRRHVGYGVQDALRNGGPGAAVDAGAGAGRRVHRRRARRLGGDVRPGHLGDAARRPRGGSGAGRGRLKRSGGRARDAVARTWQADCPRGPVASRRAGVLGGRCG